MQLLGNPLTQLVIVLLLAGSSVFGFARDERFGYALLGLAGLVAIAAIINWMRKKRGGGGPPQGKPPEGPPPGPSFGDTQGNVGSQGQSGGTTIQHNYPPPSRDGNGNVGILIEGRASNFRISGSGFSGLSRDIQVGPSGSLDGLAVENTVFSDGTRSAPVRQDPPRPPRPDGMNRKQYRQFMREQRKRQVP